MTHTKLLYAATFAVALMSALALAVPLASSAQPYCGAIGWGLTGSLAQPRVPACRVPSGAPGSDALARATRVQPAAQDC